MIKPLKRLEYIYLNFLWNDLIAINEELKL